ncbi:lipocalin-like domain-containing protein [Chitinophaga japonensis]|nr:lipocalin-like domain-containing protein [Chitinophaga japonensis]
MKRTFFPVMPALCLLLSCSSSSTTITNTVPLTGTWRLVSATTVAQGDSSFTDYTKGVSMIKIINDSHFAFLKHEENAPQDSSNHFGAGGGSYTLEGDTYTEHLDYFADRNWEGKTFVFTVSIHNDTLTQRGIEKVESAGVDREIIERYVRVK